MGNPAMLQVQSSETVRQRLVHGFCWICGPEQWKRAAPRGSPDDI